MRQIISEYERFLTKIQVSASGCWEWTKGYFDDGYPGFWSSTLKKTVRGNRFSLEQKIGRRLLESEQALHTCDNSKCVNPDHLYVGSHQDNMDDIVERGNARGIPKSEEWKVKARAIDPEKRRAAVLIRHSRKKNDDGTRGLA